MVQSGLIGPRSAGGMVVKVLIGPESGLMSVDYRANTRPVDHGSAIPAPSAGSSPTLVRGGRGRLGGALRPVGQMDPRRRHARGAAVPRHRGSDRGRRAAPRRPSAGGSVPSPRRAPCRAARSSPRTPISPSAAWSTGGRGAARASPVRRHPSPPCSGRDEVRRCSRPCPMRSTCCGPCRRSPSWACS